MHILWTFRWNETSASRETDVLGVARRERLALKTEIIDGARRATSAAAATIVTGRSRWKLGERRGWPLLMTILNFAIVGYWRRGLRSRTIALVSLAIMF